MKLYYLAFSARGLALAQKLAGALGGEAVRCGGPVTLRGWTDEHFRTGAGLVYVGACGIAVRAVAPCLCSKETDPAVVAVDEQGTWAVPLLSGHLGGANALARAIGSVCGAQPVLTTATDAGGLFPIDDWARRQGCAVADVHKIKDVSAALLAGRTLRLYSDWPIAGTPPAGVALTDGRAGCDAALTLTDPGPALWLAPRVLALGVGCRRGIPAAALEEALAALLEREKLCVKSICKVCTIDAGRISEETIGKNFPNTPMLAAIVKVSGVIGEEEFIKDMEGSFKHKFASKPQVIEGNMLALKRSLEEVQVG